MNCSEIPNSQHNPDLDTEKVNIYLDFLTKNKPITKMAKVNKLTRDGQIPNFRDVTMGMYRTGVVELSEKKREGRFFYQMVQGYLSDDMYDMIMEYGVPRIFMHIGVAAESSSGLESENDGKKKIVFEIQVDVPEGFKRKDKKSTYTLTK